MADTPLPPGSVIGILGGGQLGRMLSLAAAELGFSTHIYAPPGDNPATDVARSATLAAWDDESALAAFADAVDVITYEFENVPEATARFLASRKPVRPNPDALAVAQDRLAEKTMATGLGLAVPAFATVDSRADLDAAMKKIAGPSLLKTRRLGYDGKGQVLVGLTPGYLTVGLDEAWTTINGKPAILEKLARFKSEISALVARGIDGATRAFDVPENQHHRGILATSTVPAFIAPSVAAEAIGIGERIAVALDYVGLLAVELFIVEEGGKTRLLFNEIAPRVHNSGHWTTDACLVSQFEMHIRAIAGWPLPDPVRHSDVVMTNLIGADNDQWQALAAQPGTRLHLYGKGEARPGRKMGHVNRISLRKDR